MKVIYSIILLFLPFFCFGQKDSNTHKILFNVNYGISFPINTGGTSNYILTGPFQKIGYYNTSYGSEAKKGIFLNGSLSFPITHNRWSVMVLASYYLNEYESPDRGYMPYTMYADFYVMNLQGTEYKEYNLLVGIMKTFTKNRFNLDIWAILGYAELYAPGVTFDEYDNATTTYYYNIPSANAGGAAIDVGVKVRYRIVKKLFFTVCADFYHSGFTYANNWTVNPTPPTIVNGHVVDIDNPPANITERINLINISGGLAYQF